MVQEQSQVRVYNFRVFSGHIESPRLVGYKATLPAIARMEGNASLAAQYWPVLTRWAEYLKAKGFDVTLPGQREQRRASQGRGHAGPGLAHQQRLLLPMPPHEGGGTQAAEQRRCGVHVHRAILDHARPGWHMRAGATDWRSGPCAIIPA